MSIKQKNGISLIVLVITIIVMIILATAIILTLNGSGIIGKAHEAKTASDLANAKNVVAIARAEWELNNIEIPFKEFAEGKLEEAGYKVGGNGGIIVSESGAINAIYIGSDDRQAIIPEGFTVSTLDTEDTVTEGLVVKDSKGNEFVWVPVDDFAKFERTTTYNGTITSPSTTYYTEPFSKTTVDQITLSLTNDLTGEWKEYAAMRASVQENKGFYIGRYEAGTTKERTTASNGTTDVVIQKNKPVYTYVAWGPSMTDTIGEITCFGENEGVGAVELSRNLYKNSNSVVSTLCYGVQWDATLQFIYNTDEDYITNSVNKGNYTGSLNETGYYEVNNIYDMAGNVWEWTMEANSDQYRVVRGGYHSDDGEGFPASVRDVSFTPMLEEYSGSPIDLTGFRVTLYIK